MQILHDVTVIEPDGSESRRSVVIERGRIQAVTDKPPASLLLARDDVDMLGLDGHYLTPGLIDGHIHGGYGTEFSQSGVGDIHRLLNELPKHGITGILATLLSANHEAMLRAINTVEEAMLLQPQQAARILGLHLEGPFLSKQYPGVHPVDAIRGGMPDERRDELETLLSPNVRLVTLAPETDTTGELLGLLQARGVVAAAGHCNATYDEMARAVQHGGLRGATHLFNAMRPFHHREPGVIGYVMNDPEIFAELICDGHHLHAEAVRTALRLKRFDRTVLVSDALALAGQPEGSAVPFGDRTITLKHGSCCDPQGRLAGAGMFLDGCVKQLVNWGLRFGDAIRMASTTPADYMGLYRPLDTGRIAPGHTADLVLWDKETLQVRRTWINGQLVYDQDGSKLAPAKLF